ncbi:MAG: aldehyde dehydrogenase family protein [Roseitalea sp.]|nr:aldehyde dehydrogenase family protein [Roseitalea sp.]MBO6953264.1 aldehyde dehydrogenase family protein [Rhizobiaceae bacterium]MBO6593611.1 aldehyde dehydrogenase family protein [Roseitalea sp.]MBO6601007.1 aldehyde dehydrogenase family protein [Roseitalea sp.]MBO6612688.1 aldehyde dehydrogenase family protein [Roseitalea sp.]
MTSIADLIDTMDYGPAPESADIVEDWLAGHQAGFGHFIDGRFTRPGDMFAVSNPATGETIAHVTQGTAADVDAAVKAARGAQGRWAGLSGHKRARWLYALARRIQQHARFLAVLETIDNGKPIREARDIDVPLVARHFYHHAGWAEIAETEFSDAKPVGVCGQIIPWNFPLLMLAWKIAPALAAGNTVVLKPAEYTPLTALAFAKICDEVGLPRGVVNIVTGDGATGAAIVAHEGIDKLAFTGSTDVGRLIRRETAGSGKKLTLELGGKSPFIVFADADLDAAVEGVVDAIWFNQGQVCCAGARILVAESVAERFGALLRQRMAALRVGDPLDKSTDVGAIVHPVQLARIEELMARGVAEGADLYQGEAPDGCFYPPTLATGVEPASTLATEEIFGPVATLTTFRTPADAIALANNTRYGLAASIWSENVNLCLGIAADLKAGVVWINCTNVFDAGAGFGGYRESGFGREGGREGMMEYLSFPAPKPPKADDAPAAIPPAPGLGGVVVGIDRTAKLYVGGKQKRPDGGYSYPVTNAKGEAIGLAGHGNRKDIRDAVEAAHKAVGWGAATGHNRAQVLYYLAENLAARADEFTDRLKSFGQSGAKAKTEVETAIQRCFWYAAQADKFDGAVHQTKSAHVTLAMHEPLGVTGIACPTPFPLLGFVSLVLPAVAMGNRVVAIPSQTHPLAATDLYQVLETSDVPGGVINIVTGERDELAKTLADHDGVDGLWYFGSRDGIAMVEQRSAGNLKQTWTEPGMARDWTKPEGHGRAFLHRATQVKNVWVPYGE